MVYVSAMKEQTTPLYGASLSPLTKNMEMELASSARAGNAKARETLIRSNIRFAISYGSKFYGHGLSKEDIDAEAIIGLIKAVDHFDPSKGNRLITLSTYYIMDEILGALNNSGYVQHQSDARSRMLIKINKELRKLNPDLSEKEKLLAVAKKTGFSVQVIRELLEENTPCLSLDLPSGDKGSSSIQDMLEDTALENQELSLIRQLEEEHLYQLLETLSPKEQEILCMLYGLKNYREPLSLSEISGKFGTSKQAIFNIKNRSLKQLKKLMEDEAA